MYVGVEKGGRDLPDMQSFVIFSTEFQHGMLGFIIQSAHGHVYKMEKNSIW